MSNERGARQHFLPAGHIGSFSEDEEGKRRRRTVWVRRRGRSRPFLARAENLAWAADLYTLQENPEDPYFIDRLWDSVEQNLAAAGDALRQVPDVALDAWLWVHVLARFVTDLFVRSPKWEEALGNRFVGGLGVNREDLLAMTPVDNANRARMFEHQRISSAVLRAEWHVLRTTVDQPFISNDLGLSPMGHWASQSSGYAVPLAKDIAVAVLNSGRHVRLDWNGNRWVAEGFHVVDLPREEVRGLNRTLWATCGDAIYGRSQRLVAEASSDPPGPPGSSADGAIALGGLRDRQPMEHTEWQVSEIIAHPPFDDRLSWSLGDLDGSWIPGVTPEPGKEVD
jgi:hypothetical protein